MIKVLIADDHPIFREGLKRILADAGNFMVVGEATNGREAVEQSLSARPDIVLLDISMPGKGGIETAQEIKDRHPKVRILMLTIHPEDSFAVRCLKEGVDGYMTKDAAPSQLTRAIDKICSGGKYVSPSLAERLAVNLGQGFVGPLHESLSERELEVMLHIAAGKTVGEIAEELHLSVKTISTYRSRILIKMDMRNNAEIMRYAMQQRLVS
jgi:two-component system invasion response regulator UvrY